MIIFLAIILIAFNLVMYTHCVFMDDVNNVTPAAPYLVAYTIYKSPCDKHRGYRLILTDEGLIMARCTDCGHLLTKTEVERVLNGGA